MSLEFETRPASYAVIIRGESVLLAYWKQDGREGWTLPGGGLDLGEHPVDGCRREILEETGYEAEVDRMLGIDVGVWPASERIQRAGQEPRTKDLEALRLIYAATVTGGELTHEVDGSTTHAAWVPLDKVPDLQRVSLVDAGLRLYRERPENGRLG